MADLKQGTTVGGNTIWTQGNLPLIPAGDFISYKGFKIYTSNDKPTATDLGFLPAVGGTISGDLQVQGATTLNTGTVSGVLVFTKKDTSIQFNTAADKDTLSINYSNAGNFGIWNTTQNKWAMYRTPGEQWIFSDTGGVRVNTTLNVLGATTLATVTTGDLTASNLTATGRVNAVGANFTAANASIELGSLTTAGTPFIDFHTSGTNVDYDIRLSANSNSVSITSPSTLANFNLQTTQYLRLHNGMTSGITMGRNSVIIRDHYNGNVTISASKKSDTENIGGDLYLGYNSGNTNFTNTVRLESKLTWKGSNELVNADGKLVGASLDTAYLPLSGGVVTGDIITSASVQSRGGSLETWSDTSAAISFRQSNGTEKGLVWVDSANVMHFRNKANTFSFDGNPTLNTYVMNASGYVTVGGSIRLQGNGIKSNSYSPGYANLFWDHGNGNVTLSGGVSSAGNAGDLMLGYNAGSGYWTRNVTIEVPCIAKSSLSASGRVSGNDIFSVGAVYANNGSTYLNPDGNVVGSVWTSGGGVLSTHIYNVANERASAWANQQVNAYTTSTSVWTIGTYLMGIYMPSAWVALGQLVNGSDLRPATTAGDYDPNTSFAGTYMCCGRSVPNQRVTTWKRVG